MIKKPMEIKFGNEDIITPAGIENVGLILRKTKLAEKLNNLTTKAVDFAYAVCAFCYLAILCQGKNDFTDIRELRESSAFYRAALGINDVPSESTFRQRINEIAADQRAQRIVKEENAEMLKTFGVAPKPTFNGYVPIDVDVSVHDNSNTKKEGVEWTYKGCFGYAPIYAYIGTDGYALNVEFRDGSQHSQTAGTVDFLRETIMFARKVTSSKLLIRLDSGNDSQDNINLFRSDDVNVDFIIKRNLRKESHEVWLEVAKSDVETNEGTVESPRDGKYVYRGSVYSPTTLDGVKGTRIVYEITVRESDKYGQLFLVPTIEVETWWTSLDSTEDVVIQLYHEHATMEQYHSEIKTDMDLERFPSGKRATNAFILCLAIMAYNILRIIGQLWLRIGTQDNKRNVTRIRVKTVIERFVLIAGRLITHARKTYLALGRSSFWRFDFAKLHAALCA
jgi:hypothetical protein